MKAGCDRFNLGAEEGDNGLRAISVVLINVRVVKIKLDTAKILFDEFRRCITVFLSTDAEAKLSKSSRAPCIDQSAFAEVRSYVDIGVDSLNCGGSHSVKVSDQLLVALVRDE